MVSLGASLLTRLLKTLGLEGYGFSYILMIAKIAILFWQIAITNSPFKG